MSSRCRDQKPNGPGSISRNFLYVNLANDSVKHTDNAGTFEMNFRALANWSCTRARGVHALALCLGMLADTPLQTTLSSCVGFKKKTRVLVKILQSDVVYFGGHQLVLNLTLRL